MKNLIVKLYLKLISIFIDTIHNIIYLKKVIKNIFLNYVCIWSLNSLT